MTTNPHSTNSPPSSHPSSNPPYRRLSYASVAASATSGLSPSRPNAFSTFHSPSSTDMSTSQQQPPQPPQATRQRSRSSLQSMEIDGQSGNVPWKRPGSGWSNDVGRTDDRMGCPMHFEHPPFFTPSYLRQSRHVQRLKKAWETHVAELQENQQLGHTGAPSLSTSSSNANLSKMHPSHIHRSVVQDVVERTPPFTMEDASHPLPSRLSEVDKCAGLEILGDGSEARLSHAGLKQADEAASVRSDFPMPRECGMYYFEITVLSRGADAFVGLGISTKKVNLNRLPGWEAESWAYHGDDGCSFACTASPTKYGPKFTSRDVVGCGVNFRTGNVFFTKNGVYLGVAFANIKGDRFYPSVGMKKAHDHVSVNFGRYPFVFDIDRVMEQERQIVMADIRAADLAGLHPPDDENALIHNLIGQYLAHEGYIETAKAFASDVNVQSQSLSTGVKLLHLPNAEDDVHAANRQKIRKSILDGDIDKALKYTNCFYPHVLDENRNRDIHFRLRCRKFIEMMRRYTGLSSTTSSPTAITKSVDSLSSNGHVDGGIHVDDPRDAPDPIDTQMELDDQLHREASKSILATLPTDDVDMDASQELPSKASLMKQNELLSQALAYGQELQSIFGNDPRQQIKKQLSDIFAIMAYTNPAESVVGQLLDPQGRVQIAEDLNGAILVSLGKPSSAALEKLTAQTEALMDEVAVKTGGAAAFVNARKDFLQA